MKNFSLIKKAGFKYSFLLIMSILVLSTNLVGQLEYSYNYTFFVEQGQTFTQDFSDQNNNSTTGWTISPDNLGISFNGSNILTGDINYVMQVGEDYPLPIKITISHNGISSGVNNNTNLIILRPGIDIVLVLDRSGSMAQTNLTSGVYTKWNVLTESVQNFLTEYNLFPSVVDVSGYEYPQGNNYSIDGIGVVYFDHDNSTYSFDNLKVINPDSQTPTLNPKDEIITDMASNVVPRGATCLGGGVIEAHKLLFASDDHKNKHIVVFTDGLQNMNPVYDNIGSNNIIHKNTAIANYDGFNEDLTLDFNDPDIKKFKIHSICLGDNANAILMQDLASAHPTYNGEFKHASTTNGFDYEELDAFFTEIWVDIMTSYSPALVNREQIVLRNDSVKKSFIVNETVDKVLIKAVGIPDKVRNLIMIVKKGEKTFPQRYYSYSGAMKYFFADKKSLDSLEIRIGGEWQVTFKGDKGTSFSTTYIVNDEYIDYECSLNNNLPLPGNILIPTLKVWAGGKPVNENLKAEVLMFKPGKDVNDIFAKAKSPTNAPKDWPTDSSSFKGQDKFEKLLAFDSVFVSKLKSVKFPLTLVKTGDGNYSTITGFTNTKESGVYKFIFRFTGEDDSTGTYQRYHMLTKVIDFGESDFEKSSILVDWDFLKKKFKIRPVNKYGYLLGPNRLNNISIKLGEKKLELKDNLDGTYTAKAPIFSIFKRNQKVEANVKSMEFFDKNYKDLKRISFIIGWFTKYKFKY